LLALWAALVKPRVGSANGRRRYTAGHVGSIAGWQYHDGYHAENPDQNEASDEQLGVFHWFGLERGGCWLGDGMRWRCNGRQGFATDLKGMDDREHMQDQAQRQEHDISDNGWKQPGEKTANTETVQLTKAGHDEAQYGGKGRIPGGGWFSHRPSVTGWPVGDN